MTTGSNTWGPTVKYSASPLAIHFSFFPLQDLPSAGQDAFSAQSGQIQGSQ